MVDLYRSGAYRKLNPDWHASDAPHKVRALADLIRYCGLAPRTITEVGCGTGAVLAGLKAEFDGEWPSAAWEGWDIAPDAIRIARESEGERLQFVQGAFEASERESDLILAIDVIEHVPDDVAFLEALRARAPWLLCRIPLDLSVLDLVRPDRLIEARERYGHRHFYTRELALDLLRAAGLRPMTVRYDRVPPPRNSLRRRVADGVRRSAFAWDHDRAVLWLGGYSLLVLAYPA